MKSISKAFSIAAILALLISVMPVFAADYIVGVKVGDWIEYDVDASWSDPETEPVGFRYELVKLAIQSLDGTDVTVLATIRYRDGAEETNTISRDIERGGTEPWPWIISANLTSGDPIAVGSDMIIDGTVTRTYIGASREANFLNMSQSYEDTTSVWSFYWDQSTGVLLELFLNVSSPAGNGILTYEAVATNVWGPVPLQEPQAALTGKVFDHGVDVDDDGTYDYLYIGVEVNVTEAGDYIIEVDGLLDSEYGDIDVSDWQWLDLEVGIHVVNISLNGVAIYASGINPTTISLISLEDGDWSFRDTLTNTPLSRTYSYTEFDAPAPLVIEVEVGNWAEYNMIATWQSTDPNATEPPQFEQFKELERLRTEIQSVFDTHITVLMTYYFKNGTYMVLPPTSADMRTQFLTFLIPGNLIEGDVIPGSVAIDGTVLRSYAGMSRSVNYIYSSTSFYGTNMTQITYWDKATGILCEMLMETSTLTNSYMTTISTSLEMTETNMWKRMTELSCSSSKDTITEGDSIVVSGSLNITLSGKTVTLTYKKPDGSTLNRTVTTGSDGSYSDSYTPEETGSWTVTASWEGDPTHSGATSLSQSLMVNTKPAPFIETPLGIATLGGGITAAAVAAVVLVLRKRKASVT